ncbi:endonuclease/exonuclease/phosphatase family protein [Halobacteria archaeon AArc-dxtr1]|nr:endonuclease/exonuclease/phosphatase family protein [Halobacteria archaeon AArc-dxtr1]
MVRRAEPGGKRTVNGRRRQFLRSVGAAGIGSVFAGCVSDDADDENDDSDPATFVVSDLDPETATAMRDQTADVTATVENVGDEEGTQDVDLRIDDDGVDSETLTLESGERADVSFAVDIADLEGGEYEHAVATADDAASGTITVEAALEALTYNIRLDLESVGVDLDDGEDPWDERRDRVVDLVDDIDPDIIGAQEVLPHQLDHLEEDLPAYEWYGVARDEDGEGEAVPVGWRWDRFEAIETGTFWLSETPDEPSQGWDSAFPRVVSWAELEERSSGTRHWVASVHFDNSGEEARLESAKMIRERVTERLGDGQRCIVLGDFNARVDEEPYEVVTDVLVDSRTVSAEVEGPEGTYHGWNDEPDPEDRIDYVFVPEPAPVERYQVIPEDHEEGYRSDHLPVSVRIDSYSLEK